MSPAGYSLKSKASFGTSADGSEELWHSIDFDFALLVDIKSSPEGWELSIKVRLSFIFIEMEMGANNLVACLHGVFLGNPESSSWEVIFFTLGSIGGVHALHEGIVGLSLESIWGVSHVGFVSTESAHVSWEVHHLLLNIGIIIGRRRGIAIRRFRLRLGLRLGFTLRLLSDLMEGVEFSLLVESLSEGSFDVSGGDQTKEGNNSKSFHVIIYYKSISKIFSSHS